MAVIFPIAIQLHQPSGHINEFRVIRSRGITVQFGGYVDVALLSSEFLRGSETYDYDSDF
jgi:hypothetical protein